MYNFIGRGDILPRVIPLNERLFLGKFLDPRLIVTRECVGSGTFNKGCLSKT